MSRPAAAIPITPADFTGSEIIEGFEAVPLGPNHTQMGATGYSYPGVLGPFTFPSGLLFTAPVPNPGGGAGASISDYARGDADFGLGANGNIDTGADVAFGVAFMGNSSTHPLIEYAFDTDQLRVGAYVNADDGTTVTLSVYDAGNVLLESTTIGGVPLANWANNFIGIQQVGIRRMVLSVELDQDPQYFVVDNVTFERQPSALAVPSLSIAGLLALVVALGAAGIALLRRS